MRLSVVFLGCFNERFERFRLIPGHISEDFTIQIDTSVFQAFHETTISQTMFAGSRVDALDPESPELTLLQLTTDIGVLTGFFDSLVSNAECVLAATAKTFRLLKNFFCGGRASLRRV